MDRDDLPDLLQLNGLSTRAGMFGAGSGAPAPATRLPSFLASPPNPIPFTPAIPAYPAGDLSFSPTVSGALVAPSPQVDFVPPAPLAPPAARPAYRVPSPEAIAAAQAKQRRWGVPASVSLAQFAIEGHWGDGMPKDSNNPFGIKAVPGYPSVRAWTHEYEGGKVVRVQKDFRKYASLEDAWEGRSKMLATSKYYAAARPYLHDPDAFVDAIAGTYAPGNPTYAKTLKGIMKSNHLYQYDTPPPDASQ